MRQGGDGSTPALNEASLSRRPRRSLHVSFMCGVGPAIAFLSPQHFFRSQIWAPPSRAGATHYGTSQYIYMLINQIFKGNGLCCRIDNDEMGFLV